MRKILLAAIIGLTVVAGAGVLVVRSIAAKEDPKRFTEPSAEAAAVLQVKIDAIKDAEANPHHPRGAVRIEITDT